MTLAATRLPLRRACRSAPCARGAPSKKSLFFVPWRLTRSWHADCGNRLPPSNSVAFPPSVPAPGPAATELHQKRQTGPSGPSRGQEGASENRVYHGLMAFDTSTVPRQPTPAACPDPPIIQHPAPPLAGAPGAPGAGETEVADTRADLDLLGNRIAERSARIQAATYELLCDLREFDRRHGWEGFRSCAHWLNWRIGLDLGAAREKLRVAAALADLNHLSAAMACGRLSYSIVRALTRVATPATEARLIAVACGATAAQVERLVRAWREADRAAQPDAEKLRLARRMLSTRVDDDGMLVLRARLTPEVGAVVLRALEAALEQVPAAGEDDQDTGIGQRRADALGLLAESALAGGLDPGTAGDRFQVTVHVDAAGLSFREAAADARHVSAEIAPGDEAASEPEEPADAADQAPIERAGDPLGVPTTHGRDQVASAADLDAGQALIEPAGGLHRAEATCGCDRAAPVSDPEAGQAVIEQAGGLHVGARAARRVACDAGLVVVHHGADGGVLDVGRRTRTIPTALRRALESRDRNQCQFPGCTSPHCDAHHVVHWADGGRRSSVIWSRCVVSTTARCTRRAFGWSLTVQGSSSSCVRMAGRYRRWRRRRAGREPGIRWRRPWRAWRQPASASGRIPLPPSGMASRWT